MKKTGMLNRDIASVLARMGHTDTLIIADCGLPIPDEIMTIDLSIKLGTPDFLSVLESVADDMTIEKMALAEEIKTSNLALHSKLKTDYAGIPTTYLSHENLKRETSNAKAVIRTGETTPFANVILKSGVIF
ncbi:D-ribose pyranase [Lentibacillus amyloliquefaciens]|uniref:D-ribose pyranase n=1 Tax=Lentibacillus amyloliquefaciens TaxID=1472767 RepID=A0A0U3NUL0_9BACI|nr:D-ribose pyranase [Lentibacillus amyloliquefaciens]ALX50251.1 ribose pyranase [Lentibacillus amyloliquefaciens]